MMEVLKDLLEKSPAPFVAWLGLKCFIIVDHPEDVQVIMSSKGTMEKGDNYRFFNRGVGLFAAPGMNSILWTFFRISFDFIELHSRYCSKQ